MNRHLPPQDTLDLALDDLVSGNQHALSGLDEETQSVIDQLFTWAKLGGLESFNLKEQPAPTASFAANPWSSGASHQERKHPVQAIAPSPSVITPPRTTHWSTSAVWSAIAWTLIAALIGGAIYGALPFFRDDQPGTPTLSALQPGSATPATDTSDTAVNYGGDAGRSWNFGDTEPFTGSQVQMPNIAPPGTTVTSPPLVLDDSIIVTISDPKGIEDLETFRYDLNDHSRLWTSEVPMLGPFATDGERLYGWWLGHDEEGKAVASPGALSLDTGEVLFAVPLQGLEPSGAAGPVVYDGVVYFPDRYGNVTAYAVDEFGPDWGGPLWRTLQLPPNPFMDIGISPGFDTPSPSAELVVNDDGVFVVRASKTIVKLDRMTGEELASINLIDLLRGDIGPVSIQAVGNKLVVSAQHDQGASDEYAGPMSVLVLGTTSLDAFARTDMSEVRSNMVATLEWIYVAGRIDPQAPVEIFRINPVTGEISKPFADFGVPAHGWIGLSLSGTTLMATTSTGLYGFIDIESQSVIVSNVLKTADDGTLFYPYQLSPFQLSGQNPVALTSTGNILLIGD